MNFDIEIQNVWEAIQRLRRIGLCNSSAHALLVSALHELYILEKTVFMEPKDA